MADRIQIRRGDTTAWNNANPVLEEGEIGLNTTLGQFKIGDGNTQWSNLDYYPSAASLDTSLGSYIQISEKGSVDGVATLDSTGKLTSDQIPASLATTSYVDTSISNLIAEAPGALDTLNELAAAINDDASYAATITTALGNKQDKVSGVSNTEIGYLDGVTGGIQAQLNTKASLTGIETLTNKTLSSPTLSSPTVTIPGLEVSYTASNLIAGSSWGQQDYQIGIYDVFGFPNPSTVPSNGDIAYLTNTPYISSYPFVVTNASYNSGTTTWTGTLVLQDINNSAAVAAYDQWYNSTPYIANFDISYSKQGPSLSITSTEIGYLDGVTSNIQTQIDSKAPLSNPTFTGTVTLPNNTVTNAMLAGSIANNKLQNSSITINGTQVSLGGSTNITTGDALPAQSGNAGKYLTTDGTNASWATVSGGGTPVDIIHPFAMIG